MEWILLKYGYLLLFLGVAIEGEAFLLAGAFLAHLGYFKLIEVMALALAANFLADQFYYLIAQHRGRPWLEKRFGSNPRYQKFLGVMAKHGNWLLFFSRYCYGFRILIPAACGATGMSLLRFSLINLAAGLLWVVPTALLGYYFGASVAVLFENLHHYQAWTLGLGILALVAFFSLRFLQRVGVLREIKLSNLHALIPFLIGVIGFLNLLSALMPSTWPRMAPLEAWLPLEVVQQSRPLMLFSGLALLQVMAGLRRRKGVAWYVAVLALSVSILLHLGRNLDLHHSLVAGLLLLYLIYFRKRFYARSDPASLLWGLATLPVVVGLVLLYASIGFTHLYDRYLWPPDHTILAEAFRSGILILDPLVKPLTHGAQRFLASVQGAGWLARFYLLILLFRPVILRDRQEAPQAKINELYQRYSRHSLAPFALQTDKHHLLVAEEQALVAYATRGAVTVTCGDPLCPPELLSQSIQEFWNYCRKNGWTPCFYEVAEENLPHYHALGLRSIKIAEEAVVELPNFSLAGGKRANLRAMVNKVAKTGCKVWRYDRALSPNYRIDEQLEEISEEWLAEKKLSELGFTIGRFSLESLNELRVFVCGTEDKIDAFCSWIPYRQGTAVVLDLMRRRKVTPSGTMDYLIANSLLQLREEKLEIGSLANAPLANVDPPHGPLERGVALLFENMNKFYGYKNLFQFKNKFSPKWEGRYLIYPRGADIPKVTMALARVHSQGSIWKIFSRS